MTDHDTTSIRFDWEHAKQQFREEDDKRHAAFERHVANLRRFMGPNIVLERQEQSTWRLVGEFGIPLTKWHNSRRFGDALQYIYVGCYAASQAHRRENAQKPTSSS